MVSKDLVVPVKLLIVYHVRFALLGIAITRAETLGSSASNVMHGFIMLVKSWMKLVKQLLFVYLVKMTRLNRNITLII